jgi:hypothetical protein
VILATCSGCGERADAPLDCRSAAAPADVQLACAGDLVVAGFVARGPAVALTPARATSERGFRLTLPYRHTARTELRLAATLPAGIAFVPLWDPVFDDTSDPAGLTVTVDQNLTYQVMAPAAPAAPRTPTYRAIAGISMGGGAAAGIGLRAPDRWDLVATLGGEPGPMTLYSTAMLETYNVGGFCDGGGLCPSAQRPPYPGTGELRSDYEHFVSQPGGGVGLTLNRNLYGRATRDLVRAFGNPLVASRASAYLPPGVPDTWLADPDRCAHPVVLHGFHDRRHNPDGALPVITVCDGGDSDRLGLGVFDPTLPQLNPTDVLLAVDKNGNGQRDAGEPIVVQAAEPWRDVGSDGVADVDEEGYDPITNPDPHGDDWHPTRNPAGTEGNGWRDPGEPFDDVGLDGVAGTCQQPAPGCYDLGEGDGEWTVNPNVARWLANDAGRNLAAARRRPALYVDAGLRDFLDSHVSSAALMAEVARLGLPAVAWNDFAHLGGVADDSRYDASTVQFAAMPENVFVRYGDPDATPEQIDAGDGRHVGTVAQAVARVLSVFMWMDARWPDGDHGGGFPSDPLTGQHYTSPSTGRDLPYAVILPPDYASDSERYPCVFFLHGYGQKPDDFAPTSLIFSQWMARGTLQKMIIVFPDGRCRDGDGCESGTFFADSPVSAQAQMETHLYELRAEIERTLRCK